MPHDIYMKLMELAARRAAANNPHCEEPLDALANEIARIIKERSDVTDGILKNIGGK